MLHGPCSHTHRRPPCLTPSILGWTPSHQPSRRVHRRSATSQHVNAASQDRPRLILGIESSCDDTGVAVVTSDGRVLGEALATQAEIHAPWGGVVPNLAMEAHKAAIDRVVSEALQQAGVTPAQLDAVAVTVGPGLALCLRVGALKAFQLSHTHQLPLVKVHHMEAHALVARLTPDIAHRPTLPFLCLLVSGGHNLLLLVRGVGDYVQLGTTLDDALGEAYDKVARLLGLDLRPSGGAALEAIARQGNPLAYKFVVPMKKYANCDFSYAGLKTSTRLAITAHLGEATPDSSTASTQPASAQPATAQPATTQAVSTQAASTQPASSQPPTTQSEQQPAPSQQSASQQPASAVHSGDGSQGSTLASTGQDAAAEQERKHKIRADIAASFQHVATVHLIDRVRRGIQWARETDPHIQHLVVAGGVACNQHIRSQLQQVADESNITLVLPPPKWCTDNGVMVAWAGHERLAKGLYEPPYTPPTPDSTVTDDTWIDLWPRWPLTSTQHAKCQSAVAKTPNIKPETLMAYGRRSARKARLQTSLTEMTTAALAAQGNGVTQAQSHTANTETRDGATGLKPVAAAGAAEA